MRGRVTCLPLSASSSLSDLWRWFKRLTDVYGTISVPSQMVQKFEVNADSTGKKLMALEDENRVAGMAWMKKN